MGSIVTGYKWEVPMRACLSIERWTTFLAIVSGLEFMGIKIDDEKNGKRGEEIDISAQDATVRTLVIPTNEELMIALDTAELAK